MSRPVVIVFTRIPRLGTGKRRLARTIGERRALSFSRRILQGLLHRLRRLRGVTRVIVATPDHHVRFHAPGFIMLPQGPGDLGERMQRAFDRYPRRTVLLVGSDIPGITVSDLRTGLRLLRGHDAVFGPAADGGYWLVGLSGKRPAGLFENPRWSSPHALEDTMRNFPKRSIGERSVGGRSIGLLRQLHDIDEMAP